MTETLTDFYTGQLPDRPEEPAPAPAPEPAERELNPDSPWVEYMDEAKDLPYYFNTDTEAVQWTMPADGICGKEDDFETSEDEESD